MSPNYHDCTVSFARIRLYCARQDIFDLAQCHATPAAFSPQPIFNTGRTTMKATRGESAAAFAARETVTLVSRDTLSRRDLLAGSAATGAAVILRGGPAAATDGKTFTILHTNDLHSNFIGMAPSSDYNPFTLHDDATRGGFARLAT
jgi:hypothetical protein